MNMKKVPAFSAAVLLTISMGSVVAEEKDMTQIRTQDQLRTKLNLEVPDSVAGQTMYSNKAQNKVQNKNQYQYQYQNRFETGTDKTGEKDRGDQRSSNRSSNRSSQSSANMGSMNRQSSGNRSSGGGGRR